MLICALFCCLETEENRYRNLIEKKEEYQTPTNSPGLQVNQTNDLEHDRIGALMILPSVDIDEDIFYYLFRCRNHELSRISGKCNVFEQYNNGLGPKLAIEVKPQHDTESVIAEFRQLYDQTIVDSVDIPEGVDIESLKSLIESMTKCKNVEVRFMSKDRICKVVG